MYYFGDEGRVVIAIELNGSKRRDRHDIVTEILKTAREGKIKTHIMYKAKLSYSQINAYLQLLVDKGFLENNTITRKKQTIRLYRTTVKGIHFIENIDAVNEMLG